MTRNAAATRRQLLDAARAEFAEYGIAGARVDRIAANAGANKAQIYHYFGSKEQLFIAVFESIVAATVNEVPIDVRDLPGYAARLAQGYHEHPDIMRLATWNRLERADADRVPLAISSLRQKIDVIAEAQSQGILPTHYPPAVLLALVLHIAAMWTTVNPEYTAIEALPDPVQQWEFVADTVRRLLVDNR